MEDDDWDEAVWSVVDALESSHARRKKAEQQWACRSCTLLNEATSGVCSVCMTPRGHEYNAEGANGAVPNVMSLSQPRKTVQATLPFHRTGPDQLARTSLARLQRPDERQKRDAVTSTNTTVSRPLGPQDKSLQQSTGSDTSVNYCAIEPGVDCGVGEDHSTTVNFVAASQLRHKGEDPAARKRYFSDEEGPLLGRQYPQIDLVAADTFIYPTNYPVREYQLSITEKTLYHNTLVSLPTGLGKTLIASVVMYNFYRWFPEGQIVFMAPTKPLVAQQIGACHEIMGIPLSDTAELQGSVPPTTRQVLWNTKRVFFCTPQSMQNDLQRRICRAERLVCLVVDEAHRATGNYAYCGVIQEVEKVTRQFRVLALSATPGARFDIIQDVIRNLRITHIESRSADDADVKKYTHARQEEVIKCSLTAQISETKALLVKVFQRITQRLLAGNIIQHQDPERLTRWYVLQMRERFRSSPNYQSNRSAESDIALLASLLHARDLLTAHGLASFKEWVDSFLTEEERNRKRLSWSKKELLQSTEFQALRLSLEHLGAAEGSSTSHPKLLKLREVLHEHFQRHSTGNSSTRAIVFTQYRTSVQEIVRLLESLFPLIKAQQFIGQGASGKSKESKGQTQKEQQEIVRKFRSGMFNVLVATCIAEEGLDIGEVDLIVSFDALTSPVRMIQRMGRTGRKRVGRVVILVTEGDEEKKLARSIASAKTVSRALTTFKSKFVYGKCSRMIPRGRFPELAALEMDIPEFHASQVAGKQQSNARYTVRLERNNTTERKDGWKLNEIEKSIVMGRYTPSDWTSRPRGFFVPVTVTRKILHRGDEHGGCGRRLKSDALITLMRSVSVVKDIVEEQDLASCGPMSIEGPPLDNRQAVGQADDELLVFSDPDGDGLHFSPLYSATTLRSDVASPVPERASYAVHETDAKQITAVSSVTDKPGNGAAHASPLRQTTITGRPSPSPRKRRSTGSSRKPKSTTAKKLDKPRDAIDDTLLERGERLLEQLKALVSDSSQKAEDVLALKIDTSPQFENPSSDMLLDFPRVARRLEFGISEGKHHMLPSTAKNCVPPAPSLSTLLEHPAEATSTESPSTETTDWLMGPVGMGAKEVKEPDRVWAEVSDSQLGRTHAHFQAGPHIVQSHGDKECEVSSYTQARVESCVDASGRRSLDILPQRSKRSLALRTISATDSAFTGTNLPASDQTCIESNDVCSASVGATSPPRPLTLGPAKKGTQLPQPKPDDEQVGTLRMPSPSTNARLELTLTLTQSQPCSICSESESFDDDLIVFCDGCDVAVHQFCYGIPQLPRGEWHCDACSNEIGEHPPKKKQRACSLCPIRSSSIAMKQTPCGHWVHVQCFMWIPEFEIEFESGILRLGSIDRLDVDRRSLDCSLCHSKRGFGIIQCAHKRCLTAFHVSCASAASSDGYKLVQVDQLGTQGEREPDTLFLGYCPLHSNSKAAWKPTFMAGVVRRCDVLDRSTEESPIGRIAGSTSRLSLLSPSELLTSQADSSSKQRKQFRRLKRKYDAVSVHRRTTDCASPSRSPWSKRVQRSQKHSEGRRDHAKVVARMFFDDEVEAPSSTGDDSDEDEEMNEEDVAFIDDSSQLIYSQSVPTPVRVKRSKRNSLGSMRAIYARSLIESPPTPTFLKRGRQMLPSDGIINTCLQELRGDQSRTSTARQLSRLSDCDGEAIKEEFGELPGLTTQALDTIEQLNGKNTTATHHNSEERVAEDEGSLLQERIETNRLKALRILEEKRLAVRSGCFTDPPDTVSVKTLKDRMEPPLEGMPESRSSVTQQLSETNTKTSAPGLLIPSNVRSAEDEFEVIIHPAVCGSSVFEELQVAPPNGSTRLKFRCDESLEVDALLSLRVAVIFVETTTSFPVDPLQHPAVEKARDVFKLFLVVVKAPSMSAVQAISRSAPVQRLRQLTSCRGVIVASDVHVISNALVSIAREEVRSGFALFPREPITPSDTKCGVDANFHDRFQFFRSTGLLSFGSVLSLSFRFSKFTVNQIPVSKFSATHWQRMLPWIHETTTRELCSYFLCTPP